MVSSDKETSLFVFAILLAALLGLVLNPVDAVASGRISATGGTITSSGGNTIHTFTSSGTFTVTSGSGTVNYLVVAGGGGGGASRGNGQGGGGAGGMRTGTLTVTAQGYTVTVGAGGAGAISGAGSQSTVGGDSAFGSITATGGGKVTEGADGGAGGSGGGGGFLNGIGGAGNTPSVTPSQGNSGGNGGNVNDAAHNASGGGGGASAVGNNAGTSGPTGGNGGAGTASTISGSSVTYAGGGGGGSDGGTAGTGGSGGGGNGNSGGAGSNATANTGGGGGGAGGGAFNGGAGGSGIVIVSYPSANIVFSNNVSEKVNFTINGSISKAAGSFAIDHPLDPANKILFHSFLESPEARNIYDGTVILDGNGEATVELPKYFDALNKDINYQLKPIDKPMPNLHIKAEEKNNVFAIGGGAPGGEVSWQVAGVRHDAYMLANPSPVEVEKGPSAIVDKGEYLFPSGFSLSASLSHFFTGISDFFRNLFGN